MLQPSNISNMSITDISVDIHQSLYVSDYKNSCVRVFTKDGVHLRSIGHDKEDLKRPWGLCVHGQYVYVTEVISHVCLCSPLMVNMSPHLVRKVRRRETLSILILLMLITMVSFMLVIFIIVAYSAFNVLFTNCNHFFVDVAIATFFCL